MQRSWVVLGLLSAVACGGEHDTTPVLDNGPVVRVAAEIVRQDTVPVTVTAVGTTEPYARATPGTRLLGRVVSVLFEEGQHVDAGQVLVRIEKSDLNARRQQVESGLGEARAVLKNAEIQVGRMRNLYREKAVPKQMLDEAETAFARAQSGVASAEAMLKEVDANLGYASVSSPLKGVVVRKFVQQGDMAAPGAPLFTVEQQDPMKVIVNVGEQNLPHIQISQSALVTFEAFGSKKGHSLTGQVETIIPLADPHSRTFQVRVVLSNADGLLQSGMFVRVQFHKDNRPGVLVPVQAVVQEGQLQGVYVIDNDRVHLKWVRLGKTFGDRVEVISGLQAGERIAISGLQALRDGSKVEVVGNA